MELTAKPWTCPAKGCPGASATRHGLLTHLGVTHKADALALRALVPEVARPLTRDRLISDLGDGYSSADDDTIEDYCRVEDLLSRILAELAEDDLTIDYTNKAGATNPVKNPLISEAKGLIATKNTLRKSLGLTGAQRKRLGAAGDGDDGFDSL
jgi:hypothetical protein